MIAPKYIQLVASRCFLSVLYSSIWNRITDETVRTTASREQNERMMRNACFTVTFNQWLNSKYEKCHVGSENCRLSSWGHFSDRPIWTFSRDLAEWSVSQTLVYCCMRSSFITLPHITKITFRICFSWRKIVTPSFYTHSVTHAYVFVIPFYELTQLYKIDDFFHHLVSEETDARGVKSVACGWNSVQAHRTPELCRPPQLWVGTNFFCKGPACKYLDIVGQTVSVATTQLCPRSMKATINST